MPVPKREADEAEQILLEHTKPTDTPPEGAPAVAPAVAPAGEPAVEPAPNIPPAQRSAVGALRFVRRQEDLAPPQLSPDSGQLTGYVLTWAYDGDGIQFTKGSFAKSLAERAGKIPLLVTHMKQGSSVFETVGFIDSGVEDELGLLVSATFLDTPVAQAIREQALAGGIKGLSIQAKPIKYEVINGRIVADEASFLEATLTNSPLDQAAEVISVREDPNAATRAAAEAAALAEAREDDVRRDAMLTLLSLEN